MDGPIELKNVTALDDSGFTLLDDVDLTLPLDQAVAVVGPAGCGKEALGLLFARQITLKNGTVKAGDADFAIDSRNVDRPPHRLRRTRRLFLPARSERQPALRPEA